MPKLSFEEFSALLDQGLTVDEIKAREAPESAAGPRFKYNGAPDLPLDANPISPIDIALAVAPGRAGLNLAREVPALARAGVRSGARMVGRAASAPILRNLPGASMARNMASDVADLAGPALNSAERATAEALARVRGGAGRARVEPIRPSARPSPEPSPAPAGAPAAAATQEAAQVTPAGNPIRHNVQYFSESKGKFEPIEDMHISHLRSAMNKLQRKLSKFKDPAKRSPVTYETLQAMKREVEHRYVEAGGLTIPPDIGKAATAGSRAMRGASGPVLARRAAAQGAIKSARAAAPTEDDALSQLLNASIGMEQNMASQGLSMPDRAAARALARSLGIVD